MSDEAVLIPGGGVEGGAGLIGTSELARALEVSSQTINNWIEHGLPVAQRLGGGVERQGRALFRLEECRAWALRNKPSMFGGGVGGKREGAGRPAGGAAENQVSGAGDRVPGGKKRGRPLGSRNKPKPAPGDATLPLAAAPAWRGGTAEDVSEAVEQEAGGAFGGGGDDSPARLKVLAEVEERKLRTRKLQMELDAKEGLLLDRAEVARTWTAGLKTLRSRLDELPSRVVAEVMRALALTAPEERVKLEGAVRGEVERVMAELAGGGLG